MAITRSWLPKAAMLWVDMERGLYDWGDEKPPRNGDGSPRVLRSRILSDCGLDPEYSNASSRIWNTPQFEELLQQERSRRDIGISNAVAEIEAVAGPISQMGEEILRKARTIFETDPDADDSQALSPAQYLAEGRQWIRLGLEVEGKLESQRHQTIEEVLAKMTANNQISSKVVEGALQLVAEYRELQDLRLGEIVDAEVLDD
jgi:hypothetical protein